jgi:putative acetyltransferase
VSVRVRAEEPGDADAVRAVVTAAFGGGQDGAPAEAQVVETLRADATAWLPRFSLVAVDAGGVVGHVLCSRAHVSMASLMAPVLVLEPLSVLPSRQREGIGTQLVTRVLAEARLAGETLVVTVGAPEFFRRFQFVTATDVGLIGPGSGPSFLALALAPDHPVGDVAYPFAFTSR